MMNKIQMKVMLEEMKTVVKLELKTMKGNKNYPKSIWNGNEFPILCGLYETFDIALYQLEKLID